MGGSLHCASVLTMLVQVLRLSPHTGCWSPMLLASWSWSSTSGKHGKVLGECRRLR